MSDRQRPRDSLRDLVGARSDGAPLWLRVLAGIGLVSAGALVAVAAGVVMSVVVAWLF